jgi:hypothetical protein
VIGINQYSSATIFNNQKHILNITLVQTSVVGIDGVPYGIVAEIGTVEWNIEDDNEGNKKFLGTAALIQPEGILRHLRLLDVGR